MKYTRECLRGNSLNIFKHSAIGTFVRKCFVRSDRSDTTTAPVLHRSAPIGQTSLPERTHDRSQGDGSHPQWHADNSWQTAAFCTLVVRSYSAVRRCCSWFVVGSSGRKIRLAKSDVIVDPLCDLTDGQIVLRRLPGNDIASIVISLPSATWFYPWSAVIHSSYGGCGGWIRRLLSRLSQKICVFCDCILFST
jgi:hypothetical protein